MTTLLVVVWFVIAMMLVLTVAMQPARSRHSWFELRRRGDENVLHRERLLPVIDRLRLIVASFFVAGLAIATAVLWQWWGLLVIIAVACILVPLVRLRIVRNLANRLYIAIEPYLLQLCESRLLKLWIGTGEKPRDQKLESTEHLLHLIDTAGPVLSENQKNIIRQGIDWHETTVNTVMVPRKRIASVKFSELIGPLVLNDLHSTGHNRFPVTRNGIDNIIGLLDITTLVEVNARSKSQTAEELMMPGALRIEDDAVLPDALALLQKSHAHVLIVVDQAGKTVGLITLADISRSLLGDSY